MGIPSNSNGDSEVLIHRYSTDGFDRSEVLIIQDTFQVQGGLNLSAEYRRAHNPGPKELASRAIDELIQAARSKECTEIHYEPRGPATDMDGLGELLQNAGFVLEDSSPPSKYVKEL